GRLDGGAGRRGAAGHSRLTPWAGLGGGIGGRPGRSRCGELPRRRGGRTDLRSGGAGQRRDRLCGRRGLGGLAQRRLAALRPPPQLRGPGQSTVIPPELGIYASSRRMTVTFATGSQHHGRPNPYVYSPVVQFIVAL